MKIVKYILFSISINIALFTNVIYAKPFFINKSLRILCNSENSNIPDNLSSEEKSDMISGHGTCDGFIIGSLEAITLMSVLDSIAKSPKICVPQDVSLQQLKKIFNKWLDKHPEKRDESAFSGFQFAIMDAFPCHKSKITFPYVSFDHFRSSAQWLLDTCKISSNDNVQANYNLGMCDGYMMGSINSLEFFHNILGGPTICFTDSGGMSKIKETFIKWAENHPETLHEDAYYVLDDALRHAFPCQSSIKD